MAPLEGGEEQQLLSSTMPTTTARATDNDDEGTEEEDKQSPSLLLLALLLSFLAAQTEAACSEGSSRLSKRERPSKLASKLLVSFRFFFARVDRGIRLHFYFVRSTTPRGEEGKKKGNPLSLSRAYSTCSLHHALVQRLSTSEALSRPLSARKGAS